MHCPTLAELPPPPAGKTGWPWTVETPQLPAMRPDGTPWPRISIVTPSYNQGRFIEETIRSVLLQGYPDLEYIVIDGGSTDGAVDIIRRYAPWLTHWTSQPDDGQASAINTGMSRATGSLLNWINSDDFLMPHALEALGCILGLTHSGALISGGRHLKCTQSGVQTIQLHWPTVWPMYVLGFADFPQDATFLYPRDLECMRSSRHAPSLYVRRRLLREGCARSPGNDAHAISYFGDANPSGSEDDDARRTEGLGDDNSRA